MKTLFSHGIAFFICLLCSTSCKKNNDNANDNSNKTVPEKIQGIWHLSNVIYNDHFNNTDNRDTIFGSFTDIIDFRTDGKVYAFVQGTRDTSTYTIPSDSQIIIENQSFEIKILTDKALSLYGKEVIGADYSEETENFTR